MRTLLSALLLPIAVLAHAQLVNGSFENNGVFSLTGWEWTCDTPVGGTYVPPGTGQWSVRKNIGNPNCSPSYLYQRIPFVQSGDYWKVSGWVRVDSTGWNALPHMGFATLNNGDFTTGAWIGSPALSWNYCWITDSVHATATDTAVVYLTCGTDFLGAGWYDGIELEPLLTGIVEPVRVHTYLDEDQILHLSAGEHFISSVQLFDAAGRVLRTEVMERSANVTLATADLVPGVYIVQLSTDAGQGTARFVKG